MLKLKNRQKGFTIIEVLIVLAIAGLILLIVFLAVPALQRNSRNTQVRNDAGAVLGYINEYASNNNGSLPVAVCSPGNVGDIYLSVDATCNTSDQLGGKIRGGVAVSNGTANPAAGATQTIVVGLNRKCDSATASIAAATSNRAVAAGFRVETASGDTNQCVES